MDSGSESEIWLDRFARRFGFGWFASYLPGNIPPSYVYAVVTVVLSEAAITGYSQWCYSGRSTGRGHSADPTIG